MKKIILVDASGLLFRAYYSMMRSPLRTTKGQPVSAVFGFLRMIFSLLKKNPAHSLAAAFDVPRASLQRSKIYSSYKATRKEVPADLLQQIPIARECLDLAGIPALSAEGFEADDVLASLAKKHALDSEVLILSGDKDLMQLAGGNIKIAVPDKNAEGGLLILDREGIKAQKGIYPEEVTSFLALTGDSSDNVPGVPGIGEKGALELINQFHSIENIYQNLENIKPALAKKLEAGRESADLSLGLVRLNTELPLSLSLADQPIALHSLANPAFTAKLRELELFSLLKELSAAPAKEAPMQLFDAAAPDSPALDAKGVEKLSKAAVIGFKLKGEILEIGSSEGCYSAPLGNSLLPQVFTEGKTFIAFDLKKIIRLLAPHGVHLPMADDIKIMAYLLNPARAGYRLGEIAYTYMGRFDESPSCFEELKNALGKELIAQGLWKTIYTEIEKPLRPLLAQMELLGVKIDPVKLGGLSSVFEKEMAEISAKIMHLAGREFNILSPKQVGAVLFEDLGLEPVKKTKTKAYSTDEESLEILAEIHPLPREILSYRNLAKLKNTYTDALPKLADAQNRVHTTLHQTVTATGRLSSGEPNLQNIPIRTELGREIRAAFIPAEGMSLISADYSQIELRLFACLSKDEAMQAYFLEGGDIHRGTAAKMFKIDESSVTPDMRRAAKTINYGISYGMSAFRLGGELGIGMGEAKQFIETYFETFSGIKRFMEETLLFASERGYVQTLLGRRRPSPELLGKKPDKITNLSHPSRFAINAVVQGTAADVIKLAMLRAEALIKKDFAQDVRLILQIHDELLFEAKKERAEEFIPPLKKEMASVISLPVPLEAEAHSAANWRDSH